jgi:predicted nucleic acid-binding protein
MARKATSIVLDSWSVIAYLEGEPPAERVAEAISDAHESGTSLLMTVVNAGEVWYLIARATSEEEADSSVSDLRQLGVEIVDADWELTKIAAAFKSRHRMSFADCFAAALAREKKATLLTGDTEFRQVQDQVRIQWLE